MVSYKQVLSKLFTRTTEGDPPPYPPSRALSVPSLPLAKHDLHPTIPPRRPRVLVRRPHSTMLARSTSGDTWAFFTRPRHNSINTPPRRRKTQPVTRSPISSSLTDHDTVLMRPTIPFADFDNLPPPTTAIPPIPAPRHVSESSNIDLLLSNEPADAKKAIMKRLEGLALALDMVDAPGGASTPRPIPGKKPSIAFAGLPPHMASLAFESLSPIENWDDEDPMDRHTFSYIPSFYDDYRTEDTGSSSHSPTPSGSVSSSSSLCTSNDPPSTPSLSAVQYPMSFHLEPIPQLRLDICKSTPNPVCPREISDYTSITPAESVEVSWGTASEQHPP